MTTIDPTTPSPGAGRVHTPTTPRFGYADSWEPYSPRKSARISSQKAAAAASSPGATVVRTPSPQHKQHLRSPRTAKKINSYNSLADGGNNMMASPAETPQKKRLPPADPNRRASGPITAEAKAKAAAALGIDNGKAKEASWSLASAAAAAAAALPTPAKTPRKQTPDEKKAKSIRAVARNLFQPGEPSAPPATVVEVNEDDLLGTAKRGRDRQPKKYTGISLDSFAALPQDDPITIYTDSHERVPELDTSAENPFLTTSAPEEEAEPVVHSRLRNRARKVNIPGEGPQLLEDAVRREDGLVYVFRGKTVFRKFSERRSSAGSGSPARESVDAASTDSKTPTAQSSTAPANVRRSSSSTAAREASAARPLRRSAIKPRLLFPPEPPANGKAATDSAEADDDEADTDVEGMEIDTTPGNDADPFSAAEAVHTPADLIDTAPPATPRAPRFAPAVVTPPTTVARSTRSGDVKAVDEPTPMKAVAPPQNHHHKAAASVAAAPRRNSPFNSWRRTKSSSADMVHHAGAATGVKRQGDGDGLARDDAPAAKKSKA